MMTHEEIAAVVSELTYKPGWTLKAEPLSGVGPGDRCWFIVSAVLENTYQPGSMAKIGFRNAMPPFTDERSLLGWIRQELGRIECHERDEWLRYRKVMIFDPHRRERVA